MAGTVINTFSTTDINILNMMEVLDELRKGRCHIMLTNLDNTSAPVVKIGSIVEVAGTTYEFDADTAISGTAADGLVYIKMIPYLDGTTWKLRPEWTNTAPVVSAAKRGLYGVDANENHRYVYMMLKSGSSYSAKMPYYDYLAEPMEQTKIYSGTWSPGGPYTYNIDFDFPIQAITEFDFRSNVNGDMNSLFALITDISVSGNRVSVTVRVNNALPAGSWPFAITCSAVSIAPCIKRYSHSFFAQPLTGTAANYSIPFYFPFLIKNTHMAALHQYGSRNGVYNFNFSEYSVNVSAWGFYDGSNPNSIPILVMANG